MTRHDVMLRFDKLLNTQVFRKQVLWFARSREPFLLLNIILFKPEFLKAGYTLVQLVLKYT